MSENKYRLVEDITQEAKQIAEKIDNFSEQIKILEAKLYIGTNSWGGHPFYILLIYEIDGMRREKLEEECCTISDTLRFMLSEIDKYYKRTHKI